MSDKYVYDKDGNYQGKISDSKPYYEDNGPWPAIISLSVGGILFISCMIFGGPTVLGKLVDIFGWILDGITFCTHFLLE